MTSCACADCSGGVLLGCSEALTFVFRGSLSIKKMFGWLQTDSSSRGNLKKVNYSFLISIVHYKNREEAVSSPTCSRRTPLLFSGKDYKYGQGDGRSNGEWSCWSPLGIELMRSTWRCAEAAMPTGLPICIGVQLQPFFPCCRSVVGGNQLTNQPKHRNNRKEISCHLTVSK